MNHQTALGLVRRFPFAAPKAASHIQDLIATDMAEDVMAEQRMRGKTPGATPIAPNYFATEQNRRPRLADLILSHLREGLPLSSFALARLAKCSPSNIRNLCRTLVELGEISTIHPVQNQPMLYCINPRKASIGKAALTHS